MPIISDEKLKKEQADTQAPLSQGLSLNQAADAVESIKAFELTVDSLAGDYKDGNFLSRDGPNMDTAMKTREQISQTMRVYQVRYSFFELSKFTKN